MQLFILALRAIFRDLQTSYPRNQYFAEHGVQIFQLKCKNISIKVQIFQLNNQVNFRNRPLVEISFLGCEHFCSRFYTTGWTLSIARNPFIHKKSDTKILSAYIFRLLDRSLTLTYHLVLFVHKLRFFHELPEMKFCLSKRWSFWKCFSHAICRFYSRNNWYVCYNITCLQAMQEGKIKIKCSYKK